MGPNGVQNNNRGSTVDNYHYTKYCFSFMNFVRANVKEMQNLTKQIHPSVHVHCCNNN